MGPWWDTLFGGRGVCMSVLGHVRKAWASAPSRRSTLKHGLNPSVALLAMLALPTRRAAALHNNSSGTPRFGRGPVSQYTLLRVFVRVLPAPCFGLARNGPAGTHALSKAQPGRFHIRPSGPFRFCVANGKARVPDPGPLG